MRRPILWLCLSAALLFAAAPHAFAQETPQQTAILDAVTRWKIINTLIFVAALGWFIARYGPRFFNARSLSIQKAIQDATGLKIEADFRYSEIDRKMATLGDEVKQIRDRAAVALDQQHQSLRRQTESEIAHIHGNVQAEIQAFRAEGTRRIRDHASQLALALAERRLQDRFASGEPPELVQDFIRLVERGKTE